MGSVASQDIQSRFQHRLLAIWRPQVHLQQQQVHILGRIVAVKVLDTIPIWTSIENQKYENKYFKRNGHFKKK